LFPADGRKSSSEVVLTPTSVAAETGVTDVPTANARNAIARGDP
jgi:hypothetical protein